MAFTKAVGDTSIVTPRAAKPLVPLTSRDTIPQHRLGKTALNFAERRIPQPDRTAEDPDVAPRSGPPITGGKKGSVGNSLAGSIGKVAKLLSPLIADAFSPDLLGGRGGGMTSGQHTAFSDMGGHSLAPTAPAPSIVVPPTIAAMKDGGFIRRRG